MTAAAEGAIEAEVLRIVAELVGELRAGRPLTVAPDSHLERDLGLDSLARVELLARIERKAGVRLPPDTLAAAETPRQLAQALRDAHPGIAAADLEPVAAVSAGERIEAPVAARTLVDVLQWHARQWPQRVHVRLVHDDAEVATLSYGGLLEAGLRIAGGLQRTGLQPGEAVAIMLPTGLEFFTSFFGALLAGGVPVPMYPPTRPSQLEDHLRRQAGILASSGAPVLVTVTEARLAARVLRTQTPTLRHVVTPQELAADGAADAAMARPAAGAAGELALLQYTSGSTGNPKGVMLTHANLLANIRAWSSAIAVVPEDVCVSWLPLYHDMGLIGTWLGSLYNGNPLVLMSPLDFLSRPVNWLRAIHRYRGTITAAPNFAFELVVRHAVAADLAGLDLSCWRLAINGAEPVSPDTLDRFCAHLASVGFSREAMTPLYGLAENAVGLTVPVLGRGPLIDRVHRDTFLRRAQAVPAAGGDDADVIRFVGSGRPLPGHALRVVDAAGKALPERQVGRIEFQGPSATAGYYHNPEETARLLDGDWRDTGDLGYVAAGELFVTGRVKDMIIRGGRNLYPYELEEAIGALPGVRRGCVAVFGAVDRATASERLVAVVETREVSDPARPALRRAIEDLAVERLGLPLDEVVLAPPHSVLKTSSGKIRRAATRDLYLAGALGSRHSVRVQMLRLAASGMAAQGRRVLVRCGALLWAGWAWAMLLVLAPPVWLAVAALQRPALGWRIARLGARAFARLIAVPVEVHGAANLPAQAPCVVAANHASYVDGLVAVAALARPFTFVAKRELREHAIAGPFLRGLGAAFVERFSLPDSVEAARELGVRARGGESLFFFPEGTFTRRAGVREFRLGAFLTAVEAGLPVVPVAIRGTRTVLPDETWMPRREPVVVHLGAPVVAAAPGWQAAVALRDAVRARILAECGEPDMTA
ncbi:MAG: AMP-binding protein [Luteimonas sp.]|nr:AMP-binding protein [Luteimonas sp.]